MQYALKMRTMMRSHLTQWHIQRPNQMSKKTSFTSIMLKKLIKVEQNSNCLAVKVSQIWENPLIK